MDEDPVARKRSRGGQLKVGDDSDGAILSLMNIEPRTFVIKERSIYEIIIADDIDPKRTNVNVPNMVHKLVLNEGVDSEVVSQIFLTAQMFFRKEKVLDKKLLSTIWELIVELTKEAINLRKHIYEYYDKEKLANEKYDIARAQSYSPTLPSIDDLVTSLKTIFQKGDHMYQVMIELSSIIFTKINLNKQAHFSTLVDLVKNELGDKHGFSMFLEQNLEFMKRIRAFRNGLDHRLNTVLIRDYQFNPDTSISLPSISLNAKDTKLDETSISEYLNSLESIFTFAEVLICHLANISIGGKFSIVREIPESKRVYKHVRYCFYMPGLDFYEQ